MDKYWVVPTGCSGEFDCEICGLDLNGEFFALYSAPGQTLDEADGLVCTGCVESGVERFPDIFKMRIEGYKTVIAILQERTADDFTLCTAEEWRKIQRGLRIVESNTKEES